MKVFEYKHIVGFEETNLVGNVYYANHVRWQGRCREMFLKTYAPSVIDDLSRGLALVTLRVSCEYFSELLAFDEIALRMTLGELVQNRITMVFDYYRISNGADELIARGEQQIACMWREGENMVPAPVPKQLREALRPFERLAV